jgi:hypothetical protein
MDGMAASELDEIVAPLNFLVPMAEKPVAYNYEPSPGTPVRTAAMSNTRSGSATPAR